LLLGEGIHEEVECVDVVAAQAKLKLMEREQGRLCVDLAAHKQQSQKVVSVYRVVCWLNACVFSPDREQLVAANDLRSNPYFAEGVAVNFVA
jgi:hypothetical protein